MSLLFCCTCIVNLQRGFFDKLRYGSCAEPYLNVCLKVDDYNTATKKSKGIFHTRERAPAAEILQDAEPSRLRLFSKYHES